MTEARYFMPELGETEADARTVTVPNGLPTYAVAEEAARAEWSRQAEQDINQEWPQLFAVQIEGLGRLWKTSHWRVEAFVGMQFEAEEARVPVVDT